MHRIHFDWAFTPEGWRRDVHVSVVEGRIIALGSGRPVGAETHAIGVPGLPNLHSHAFQRGMSGLAEHRGPACDNFWSWRETMYRFALTMTPDDAEAIATQLYVEMLEAGFTRVGEFHYLHHDVDGRPYANCAEMAARIAAAGETSGINLTLLPVLYRYASFGNTTPLPEQRRFISTLDDYARLLSESERITRNLDGANLGIAPHSLRAVGLDELCSLVEVLGDRPMHMHISEQAKEVTDCIAWSGKRPLDWLLDNIHVDPRWCLIHATHITSVEADRLIAAGATVGLCPITEANLGDGIFSGRSFVTSGGRFGIGTDSNVLIDAMGELRQFEYSQRLSRQERNVMAVPGQSTAQFLFEHALAGGASALGLGQIGFVEGAYADFVSLNAIRPAIAGHHISTVLDAWMFGAGSALVDCVWTRGIKRVSEGRHAKRKFVAERFVATMARLLN